jgi:hypothetical protein
MTDQHQHRATPEQWEDHKRWAFEEDAHSLCILELRDRIAELERQVSELHATNNVAVDWRMEQDRRIAALEAAQASTQPVALAPANPAESEYTNAEWAEIQRWSKIDDTSPAPSSTTPVPTGSLVERVEIRAGGDARAAIREVAQWLRDRYPDSAEAHAVAFNLCQEATNG